MKTEYIETDERIEFFSSLSSLRDFLQRTESEPQYWKWSFIAMHMTIQSAMVIALRRTDGFGPLCENKEEKHFKHLEKTGQHQRLPDYLMKFLNLYGKIKKEGMIQSSSGQAFIPSGNEDRQMELLNTIRNEFIHFTPKSWTLYVSKAPEMFLSLLEIPKYLVSQCNEFLWIDDISHQNYEELFLTIESSLHSLNS